MMLPHEFVDERLHERRERVFLVFAGLFLGTLAMLNVLGITRFIRFGTVTWAGWNFTFAVAVGVLPYPITFLCTDFISEFYGRRRANLVVLVGLLLNFWVVFILWLGGTLPGFETVDPQSGEIMRDAAKRLPVFFEVKQLAFGAVTASMIAYLAAQFCDVYVFHLWKRLTKGRHLWLRNNGSTMISQFVDTTAVILITHFYAHALPIDEHKPLWPQLVVYIVSGYAFKFLAAMADTIPFYVGVKYLSKYLRIDPRREHEGRNETVKNRT
ncbi:MAG: queuosine precursor transporter [Phycisphaerae bacterium]